MSGSTQVSVTLPDAVLAEVDRVAYMRRVQKNTGRASRSSVVADAVALQLGAKKEARS